MYVPPKALSPRERRRLSSELVLEVKTMPEVKGEALVCQRPELCHPHALRAVRYHARTALAAAALSYSALAVCR
jgi:hypothetical protein